MRPRWCSIAISAAFSTWRGLPPISSASPAAAIGAAEPTSPWQPTSAPEINRTGLAAESGGCSGCFVFATFADSDDESTAVEMAKEVKDYLGGPIRTFGKDAQATLYMNFGTVSSDSFEHTVMAQVWSSMMCSAVYVEANLIAADGTIFGYTNGTLGTLPAGMVGQIHLTWTESGAGTIRITKATCD